MLDLVLRLGGTLLFLGMFAALTGGFVVGAIAALAGRPRVARAAAWTSGIAAVVYLAALAAGPMLTPRRVLPAGTVRSFCGFDCHLHVRAVTAYGRSPVAVRIEAWSDAARAPEWPGTLSYRLVDADGRRYPAVNSPPAEPLGPGDAASFELEFATPPGVGAQALEISWAGVMDLLVPGPGNTLVQRRQPVALAIAAGM